MSDNINYLAPSSRPVDLGCDLALAVDTWARFRNYTCASDALREVLKAGLLVARAKGVAHA